MEIKLNSRNLKVFYGEPTIYRFHEESAVAFSNLEEFAMNQLSLEPIFSSSFW